MRLQTDMQAVILAVLAKGPRHGYAIAKAVREGSSGALKLGDGQLYPALYAMEEAGWVSAEWDETDGDQPRRIYRISESGLAELTVRAARWREFADGVASLLPAPATEAAK